MGRYLQISRWLLCAVTLSVVATVISIPLISAMHIHVQHVDGCGDQHDDASGTDGTLDCDFCALYAQFTPREALIAPIFSFRAPVMPLVTVFAQPRSKARCKGIADRQTNRGPPVVFT